MRHRGWVMAGWLVLGAAAGVARGEDGPDPATPPAPETLAAQTAPATADKTDEKAAKPAKPAIEYVENRGVVFRTPDGLFEASLGFNLQVRYTHVDLDAAAGGIDADEFRVRRFKLFMSGFAFDPRLTWRFQAAFESTACQPLPRRRVAELEVRRSALGPVRRVQDAVLAAGALQRRRPPVPGARRSRPTPSSPAATSA